jgi:hypothetical protein
MTKTEMAGLVFTDNVKQNLTNLLKTNYGVHDINFKNMTYGIGMEINGTDRFSFIKNAITKTIGVNLDTISILSENEDEKKAFYVYLPEKDRNLQKRLKRIK